MINNSRSHCACGVRRALLAGLLGAAGASVALADVIPLDSRGTYLRTNQDQPAAPAVVSLAGLGFAPGQTLTLEAVGDFVPGNGLADQYLSLIGVFSSSGEILAPDQLHRVPGAIDAGSDYVSGATFRGGLPTDIAEDFAIGISPAFTSVNIEVPAGATHLVMGVLDSYYADNADPDGDLAVNITAVPEPASLALLALASATLLRRRG